jgi:recombination protein RecA
LEFAKGDYLDENCNSINRSSESPKGNKVMVSIKKTKVDKPDRRTGYYTLMYDYGIDEISDLIEVCIKYGIVQKAGAWFSIIDTETGEIYTDDEGKDLKFQGHANLVDFLREDDIILSDIKQRIADLM